jgi:hypothetical protein
MRSAVFAAVLSVACSATSAFAQQCSLADFDKEKPPASVRDVTPPTNDSKFEWGSDVDPWNGNGQGRGWHYIKNLHDKKLSLDWKKPALLIPFDKPLESQGIFCKYDYGSLDTYKLDSNAPISVSNDGSKSAQAYVQVVDKKDVTKPSSTGAELRRSYQTATGEIAAAFARIFLRYIPAEKLLQVDLSSGPGETRIGFSAEMLGVSQDDFLSKLKTSELNFKGPVALGEFFRKEEIGSIGANPAQRMALVRADGERSLKFENISAPPSGTAPMVLFAPDGSPLALTTVKLDLLGGAR